MPPQPEVPTMLVYFHKKRSVDVQGERLRIRTSNQNIDISISRPNMFLLCPVVPCLCHKH